MFHRGNIDVDMAEDGKVLWRGQYQRPSTWEHQSVLGDRSSTPLLWHLQEPSGVLWVSTIHQRVPSGPISLSQTFRRSILNGWIYSLNCQKQLSTATSMDRLFGLNKVDDLLIIIQKWKRESLAYVTNWLLKWWCMCHRQWTYLLLPAFLSLHHAWFLCCSLHLILVLGSML